MNTRKLFVLGLSMLLIIAFVASCAPVSDDPAPPANGDAPPAEDAARVALCMSGPITDGGWNYYAYQGLQKVEEDYGFDIAFSENVNFDDQESILRDYARAGFNIIIGHGFQWEDAIITVANEYPDIWFAQIGGEAGGQSANVFSSLIRSGDPGYIIGHIAGQLTESGVIGFVGAMEIPTIVEEVITVEATLEKYYPNTQMIIGYTGSWTDMAAGYEAAVAQIEEGADVIIGIGNAADMGAVQASQEREGQIKYIGWSADLNHLAPDIIVTSMIEDTGILLYELVEIIIDNPGQGRMLTYGIAEGITYLGTWSDNVPIEIKEFALAEQQRIIDGELTRESIFEDLGIEPLVIYD